VAWLWVNKAKPVKTLAKACLLNTSKQASLEHAIRFP